MVGTSSDPTSLKEYLKKYTSNDDKEKKKKKKRKAKPDAAGVIVVDEDPIWQKSVKLDEEEDSAGNLNLCFYGIGYFHILECDLLLALTDEEKPQVDEDIDVKRMRRLEQLRSKRPFGVISEDGSGWISVPNIANNMKSENQSSDISPPRQRRPRNDTPSPEPGEQSNFPAGADLSPPRQSRKRYQSPPREPETKAHFPGGRTARYDTPPPERLPKDSVSDIVTDLSPPRLRQREKHASSPEPGRISLHSKVATDADISPPRRARRDSKYQDDSRASSAADLLPPRKSKNDRSSSIVSSSKSISNLDDHDAADRAPSVADLSPPRKRRKESPVVSRLPKTGLVSGEDIKDEIDKKREEDWLR